MFTGIITDPGRVLAIEADGMTRFRLATGYPAGSVGRGASIACNGVCLSVVDTGPGWFLVDASRETLSRTTLGEWRVGQRVNLERALRLGDELGGHIVSGHVDGIARIVDRHPDGASLRFAFEAPPALARYVAAKGSVAIDGVSLTVNEASGSRFGVNIIPLTASLTNFGELAAGDRVNLEIDVVARYVARLLEEQRN